MTLIKQSYPTIFSDKFGKVDTKLFNDFQNLSICIEGVWFVGREFSTLSVQNFTELSPQQIERFDLTQLQDLHECTFCLNIPQLLINEIENTQTMIYWQIVYELGKLQANGGVDKDILTLTVNLPNQSPITASGGWFEDVLNKILNNINANFTAKNLPRPIYFKNCFGCQWSDYSIYGNSSFGTLACFLGQAGYLTVSNKLEYLPFFNAENPLKQVQEIYCCEYFKPRPIGAGYRG